MSRRCTLMPVPMVGDEPSRMRTRPASKAASRRCRASLVFVVLHEGDLGRRHPQVHEPVLDPAIGREAAAGLDAGRAEIGEDQLAGAGQQIAQVSPSGRR